MQDVEHIWSAAYRRPKLLVRPHEAYLDEVRPRSPHRVLLMGSGGLGELASELDGYFHAAQMVPPFSERVLGGRRPHAVLVQAQIAESVLTELQQAQARGRIVVVGLMEPGEERLACDSSWDDFVIRPWSLEEVVVRLDRLLGVAGASVGVRLLRWGKLLLDPSRHEVRLGEEALDLTYTEFRLLAYLMARGGRVCTREGILKDLWGTDHIGGLRTVDVHVRRLRTKLEARRLEYIATVRSVGYRLVLAA